MQESSRWWAMFYEYFSKCQVTCFCVVFGGQCLNAHLIFFYKKLDIASWLKFLAYSLGVWCFRNHSGFLRNYCCQNLSVVNFNKKQSRETVEGMFSGSLWRSPDTTVKWGRIMFSKPHISSFCWNHRSAYEVFKRGWPGCWPGTLKVSQRGAGCSCSPAEKGLALGSPGFRFHLSGWETRRLLLH